MHFEIWEWKQCWKVYCPCVHFISMTSSKFNLNYVVKLATIMTLIPSKLASLLLGIKHNHTTTHQNLATMFNDDLATISLMFFNQEGSPSVKIYDSHGRCHDTDIIKCTNSRFIIASLKPSNWEPIQK